MSAPRVTTQEQDGARSRAPDDGSGAPLLSVRDLRVHFPIASGFLRKPFLLRAVDGVSFDLHPGETLGVVGESGCGKSTLGRAILRLVEPSAGRVAWLGEDLAALPPGALRAHRRDMQIIFQDPLASLDPRMTVGDIIGEPLATFEGGLPRAERRRRVEETMRKVGLVPEMINRYPHEFSGGQAQRIGIARAMVLRPRLVICDEPVSALDVSIQAQIVNLLVRLQREHGLALVFISHDLSVVRHISHRVMVLYLGKVAEIADRDAIYRAPRHPYTQALISAVPLPDPDRERAKRRIVLRAELPSPLSPPSGCYFRTRCPKAQPVCAERAPELYPVGPGHGAACHFWDTPTPTAG
ncbi:ABC transporter ATP-binding protein [Arenibaculum pallidiluteum]|uniref:ABC transporter ATP-binding protein n=1 Tax=Arenibaculum pallidiluteum TaxID=2812559 RepID=UPI001A958A8C|nr:dipeptide ABC transporter ATP-binding protein [Arenibaculum pallidiluteum]